MSAGIGIFDSGVGGLSVVDALHRMQTSLPIRYIADTAHFPYGDRTPEEVTERSMTLAGRLVDEGAQLIIVACNTGSSAALERLRETFDVPVVGMEPPLKPAVEQSRSRRVAVLATAGTASGDRLARLQANHGGDARVWTLPMPGLADLVEAGEIAGERVEGMLTRALEEPLREGVDAVALGCTHYGFLRDALMRLVPLEVTIIDAAEPVARRALYVLREAGAVLPEVHHEHAVVASATGSAQAFAATVERLRASGASLPPMRLLDEAHLERV